MICGTPGYGAAGDRLRSVSHGAAGEGLDLGYITLLIRNFTSVNGLDVPPDEEILYPVDIGNRE